MDEPVFDWGRESFGAIKGGRSAKTSATKLSRWQLSRGDARASITSEQLFSKDTTCASMTNKQLFSKATGAGMMKKSRFSSDAFKQAWWRKQKWEKDLFCLQGHQSQLKKSIKLLCLNASFSWSEINFLFKNYVWRFLCQNFIGLGWIVCLQPQFEVILVFTAEAKLRIVYKSVLL